ncbi:MAG: hypothetical protein MUE75_13620, partial [Algoriphagus sp.]|nr:hypothetical protein [Algoriphagus sp.]
LQPSIPKKYSGNIRTNSIFNPTCFLVVKNDFSCDFSIFQMITDYLRHKLDDSRSAQEIIMMKWIKNRLKWSVLYSNLLFEIQNSYSLDMDEV